MTFFSPRVALAVSGAAMLSLTGCFPFGGTVSRDYTVFNTYTYKQTSGLGFCGSSDGVFAATIDRASDGTMTYAATVLRPNGKSNEACGDDEFPTETGCMVPQQQSPRTLSPTAADQVTTAFAQIAVERGPEAICRTIALDPCRIDRHTWDHNSHSDYVCSADRLAADQSQSLITLLNSLNTP